MTNESTAVRIEALIADAVSIKRGKLDVEGAGWNHLFVPAVPTSHGRVGLAILVVVEGQPSGRAHRLVIRLDDPEGRPVILGLTSGDGASPSPCEHIEVDFRSRLPFPDSPLDEHVFPIAINLDGVCFHQLGVHRFRIAHDGVEVASLPFAVAEVSSLAADDAGRDGSLSGGPADVAS